jgi:hypothetical protein
MNKVLMESSDSQNYINYNRCRLIISFSKLINSDKKYQRHISVIFINNFNKRF